MVDRGALEASLKSVREAHKVLEAFHREVVAFFQVLDEQLSEEGGVSRLTAFDASNFVWTSTANAKRVAEWVPNYLGRLYYDEELEVAEGEPETLDSRAAAFVAISTTQGERFPECWFGMGRPGDGTKFTGGWNFARNGLWNYDFDAPTVNAWNGGMFVGNVHYGTGGTWRARRTPLAELTSADKVRELVAVPLLEEWKKSIRGM